jgi:hypothetical protein
MILAATNLAARRDAPVLCRVCGRRVERAARQQLYCSRACRERGKERVRKASLGRHTGAPPNPPKKSNGNNGLRGSKTRSSTPQNLLREVVEIEVFAAARGDRCCRPTAISRTFGSPSLEQCRSKELARVGASQMGRPSFCPKSAESCWIKRIHGSRAAHSPGCRADIFVSRSPIPAGDSAHGRPAAEISAPPSTGYSGNCGQSCIVTAPV